MVNGWIEIKIANELVNIIILHQVHKASFKIFINTFITKLAPIRQARNYLSSRSNPNLVDYISQFFSVSPLTINHSAVRCLNLVAARVWVDVTFRIN